MSGMWNINNSYNVNNSNKKMSSKLTFNVGEKFSGKITQNGKGKEVSVKLVDGWEFSAEIDGDLESLEKGFQRFEVEGFEDGKLKLKLINKDNEASGSRKNELNDIIQKEGLSKKDIPLLEIMLKYNIPLSRENIKMVRGLIQFNDKIQSNPKEIEAFISKYLESKGIDQGSLKGQEMTQKLDQFLNAFKSLSKEEVILFLENNIEFTKENIESYNKVFKEDGKVLNIINEMKSEVENGLSGNRENEIKSEFDLEITKDMSKNVTKDIKNEGSSNNKLSFIKDMVTDNILDKNNLDFKNNPLNIKDNISTLDNLNNKLDNLNNKLDNSNNKLDNLDNTLDNLNSKLDNPNNKLVTDTYEKNDIRHNKVSMLTMLKSIMGKSELTEEDFSKIQDIINFKTLDSESSDKISKVETLINSEKHEINSENNEIKNENIINTDISNNKNESGNKDEFVNENIDKVFEDIIEKSSDEKVAINLKSDNTGNLKGLIKDKLSSQEVVKNIISLKMEEGKEVIKSVLLSLENEGIPEKVLDIIKSNINDIKLFNKISQEYYYLDLPVNINQQEYPCKLILKDNRKNGKKIDSKNVKMVITVKTGNIGIVDGYIKVLDKKIDIELKCEENFVKILNLGKEKLVSNISKLGFNISVKVSKKEDEVSLTTCRGFFNENNRANIDIKV